MASPLSIFRKYQYILLVVFGVMLMISFVIAPSVLQYQRMVGPGATENAVVVSWKSGELREGDLRGLRTSRILVQEFMNAVVRKTVELNGYPRGGISLSMAEEDIVRTMLLAEEARKMGLSVSQDAIMDFLEQFSAELIPRGQIGVLFHQTLGRNAPGGPRMTEAQLFEIFRTELLAQNYLTMMHPVILNNGETLPPYATWEYHLRLNRRVKAEVVPITVADYKDQVGDPTEEQVTELYGAGKERYPDPDSPEPGFKRRRKIAFQLVRADFDQFVERGMPAAKEEVTDKEIEDHYQSNKERYRVLDLPTEDEAAPPGGTSAEPAEESQSGQAKPADEDSAPMAGDDTEEKPAPAKPEMNDAAKQKPAASEGTDPAPKPSEPVAKDGETPAEAGDAEPEKPSGEPGFTPEKQPEEKPSEPPTEKPESPEKPAGQSRTEADPTGQYFVSLVQAEKTEATKPEGESEPSAEAAPERAAAASEKQDPEAEPAPTAAPQDPAPAEEKPAAPVEKPESADESDEPASDQPAAAKPAEKEEGMASPDAEATLPDDVEPAPEDEPKYKPLDEELREEIREELARSKALGTAQKEMDKVLSEVRRIVDAHAKKIKRGETNVPFDMTAMQELARDDMKELVTEPLLIADETPKIDALAVRNLEIGKAFRQVEFAWPPQREYFYDLAYADDIPTYRPTQIRGEARNMYFLYWKIDEQEAEVPELDNALREEVVDAWKQHEALAKAQAAADDVLARLKDGAVLADTAKQVLGESAKVIETNEFTWMSTGFSPASMGQLGLSPVEGVEGVNDGFMKAVFALQTGESGKAVNQPETMVYVIRIISDAPAEEELKRQFLASGRSPDIQQVALNEGRTFISRWIDDVEKALGVQWHRTPEF